MKVLFLLPNLATGGAERSTLELLPWLHKLGVETPLVCLGRDAVSFDEFAEEIGVAPIYLRPGRLRHKIIELAAILREERPAIIHAALDEPCLISRFAGALSRTAVVNSWININYDPLRLKYETIPRRKIRYFQCIDAISGRLFVHRFHAVTPYVKQAMCRDLWIPPKRVTVVERGRDLGRYRPMTPEQRRTVRQILNLPQDAFVALTTARHAVQKGLDCLIRAAAELCKRQSTFRLLIAGREGETTPELKELIISSGLEHSVFLLGHRNDVPQLLGASDVYVCSSLWEGAAGSIIEAMATELPVIATDIAPMRDLIDHEKSGRLFLPQDHLGLADQIVRLQSDPALTRSLAKRAASNCRERYTLEGSARGLIDLYREVLRRR